MAKDMQEKIAMIVFGMIFTEEKQTKNKQKGLGEVMEMAGI